MSEQQAQDAHGKLLDGGVVGPLLGVVLWICFACVTAAGDSVEGVRRSPNIVMLIADDQLYSDFGFMGNPRVQTPNLDELAREAAIYTDAYVPSSV